MYIDVVLSKSLTIMSCLLTMIFPLLATLIWRYINISRGSLEKGLITQWKAIIVANSHAL